MSKYNITEFGTKISTTYGLYISQDSRPISSWHDIPLYSDDSEEYVNMVVEIPRWTNAKMEMIKEHALNPIKYDVKNNKVRYVDNVYPHKGYMWNYGAIPQTWEDPNHINESTMVKGDNDPLDVCEIGQRVLPMGSVVAVKFLGVLAMIDEGETDWKIIAIAKDDPMADKLNDISDVEKYMPGFLNDTRRWFKLYKMPQGKPANVFAFDGEFKNKAFAHSVIKETHDSWKALIAGKAAAGDCKCENISELSSPFLITDDDAKTIVASLPQLKAAETTIDASVEKWHFIDQ